MVVLDDQLQPTLPPVLSRVSELVDARPEAFIVGDEETRTATLQAAKYVFDLSMQQEQRARGPVAQLLRSVEPSARPQTRSQSRSSANYKRSPSPPPRTDEEIWRPTPLESLHLEGMDVDQIWAQLELRTAALCDALKIVLEEDAGNDEDEEGLIFGSDEEGLENLKVLDDMDEDEDEDEDGDGDEDEREEEESSDEEDSQDEGLGEGVTELRDPSGDDSEESEEDQIDLDRPMRLSRIGKEVLPGKQPGGHPVLDDGFFSIAEFNAETEEAEAKDVSKGRLGQDNDDDDDDDDDADNDVDFFTAVGDVGETTFEEDDLEDGGELYYKDFFAAPSRAKITTSKAFKKPPLDSSAKTGKVRFHDEVRVKKIKSRGKGTPVGFMQKGIVWEEEEDDDEFGEKLGMYEDDEEELEESMDDEDDEDQEEDGKDEGGRETIERLKDDLFAEDEETPSKDLSTHEVRQAEIAAQIAELETQSVAPKEWTLMGEATSRSRPLNSLLEEDLEFDRTLKAVPVVTEESVNNLEEIIKRRILDNRFDDVVRKRPVDDKPFLPSRVFELNDQKSAQSLAQIYEAEYTANANGTGVDDRDGRLKKEHEELEKLWDTICYKLDALSNAHFTPKQPQATISTVSNLAATTLESALPTTKSTTSMLAPEEMFVAPSEMRSRDELTPIEKRAQRNKQRKARKRAKDQIAAAVDKFARTQKGKGTAGAGKHEREKAMKNLVKTGRGITVIGKQRAGLKRHSEAKSAVPLDGKRLKL